jgi:hypothetical protein
MVHRCTSPAWFKVLKQHVAALYLNLPTPSVEASDMDGGMADLPQDDKALFQEIVRLKLVESLLFCPTAAVKVAGEGIGRTEGGYLAPEGPQADGLAELVDRGSMRRS